MAKKTAVIAGGTSDCGIAAAQALREWDWNVVSLVRRDPPAGQLDDARVLKCDLNDPEDTKRAIDKVAEEYGTPTAALHTVMPDIDFEDTMDITWERYRHTYDVGLGSLHFFVNALRPYFEEAGNKASLVVLSSIGGHSPLPKIADYCVVKAAVSGYVRNLAVDWASIGVRVNAVSPGFLDSERVRESPLEGQTHHFHPMGRNGKPEEIANLCRFLMSDESPWITGSDYVIDGGFMVRPPGM